MFDGQPMFRCIKCKKEYMEKMDILEKNMIKKFKEKDIPKEILWGFDHVYQFVPKDVPMGVPTKFM